MAIDFFFADDARQRRPSRNGMGPLVAIGGVKVPGEAVGELEDKLEALCTERGFPPRQEFKWSPGRELWMHDNLTLEARALFFESALALVRRSAGIAHAVIEDSNRRTATGVASPELDVTRLFLERVNNHLQRVGDTGVVIVDRPGGGRAQENNFLAACLETLQSGTDYVKPDRIVLNVLSTSSKFIRVLQAADVVVGCALAFVAGESHFSPRLFPHVKALLEADKDRIGGVGLKIHPDGRYANLYHWLLGDSHFWRGGVGHPFPLKGRAYRDDPRTP